MLEMLVYIFLIPYHSHMMYNLLKHILGKVGCVTKQYIVSYISKSKQKILIIFSRYESYKKYNEEALLNTDPKTSLYAFHYKSYGGLKEKHELRQEGGSDSLQIQQNSLDCRKNNRIVGYCQKF